ncbi:nitrilase/cyanide hydratase and apolipo protein N-acyltransferase [Hyaloraphidium curvatum]|nr:nitrilase/cyanide hydratase and apolipo protein N-acyltransferase [Hyaloraphidium curvatum]
MARRLTVACVQHCASLDTAANLRALDGLIASAASQGAQLVALPEYCGGYGMRAGKMDVCAQPEESHDALAFLKDSAKRARVWLAVGSLGVRLADGRTANRSFVLDPDGAVRARYDKIHLFDVDLDGGRESYKESATIAPGAHAVVSQTPLAALGLSICYDLRFPQLYRALAQSGAEILMVPAAFTRTTGRAHWAELLRARAIENGCFVVAASQCGEAEGGTLARYGHSMVVGPWGEVLADAGEGEGVVVATVDLDEIKKARAQVPALFNDRPFEVVRQG